MVATGAPLPSAAQAIESFHLLFLSVLASQRAESFVIKGGVNLRYFFASPRYSNDLDLDLDADETDDEAMPRADRQLGKVFEGRALPTVAQGAGLSIVRFSQSKSTDTTVRWKVGLARTGGPDGEEMATKIEISARFGSREDTSVERVPDDIVKPYGHMAPLVRHYGRKAATEQKIAALALRSETKARDVFDLDLLRRQLAVPANAAPIASEHFIDAAARALELSFGSFQAEVIPFLDPDLAELYQEESSWEYMRDGVATWLLELSDLGPEVER